jgi:LysM repeat protein
MRFRHFFVLPRQVALTLVMALALNACQAAPQTMTETAPTPSLKPALLTPYYTTTVTHTPPPPDPATATPFPTPTATPRSHTVKRGEDMFGIAWQYGITLAELQTANPDVNPNFLSVDAVLIIPASTQSIQTPGVLPSPTPAGAVLGETICYHSGEGGLWCFTPVTNRSALPIESVSLDVRLASGGEQVAAGSALTPVNVIPPGETMPAAAYFSPPIPPDYAVSAALNTGLPLDAASSRYITASLENLNITIASDGKSALVEGQIAISANTEPAQVRAAAIAYDQNGSVTGFRIWEAGQPQTVNEFSMYVYSLAGAIERVEVYTEAIR